ncbi:MAG TPA: hypothetical protein PL196_10785, partial [Burkholderiaceae bacterium]|nr:hypothetical protein [Burkholderiaceae bacterium]
EAIAQLQGLAGEDHPPRRWAIAQAYGELALAQRRAGDAAGAAASGREALRLWGDRTPGYFAAQRRVIAEVSLCGDSCGVGR